jgi:hypothetical protein
MEQDFLSRSRDRVAANSTGRTRTILATAGAAFVLGAALTGYFVWRGELGFLTSTSQEADTRAAPGAEPATLASAPTPTPSGTGVRQATEAVQAVEKVAEQQGGIEARVVATEQRMDRLSLQMQAATGNAARAESLLIAFAARRAIERGEPLGYLADQLKLRFEDARPNSVRIIIAAAQTPLTLDVLIARLDGLAPTLANDAKEKISWNWFENELSSLFVVRRESAPSPQPQRRLERARLFLESGRIEAAVAEVRNLPGADEARQWIADAERYAAAKRALDRLETAAILEPRDLRDGTGTKVQQPSPAGVPGN